MRKIVVYLMDGTEKKFVHDHNHRSAPRVAFEGNFVVVTDEYGKQTAFPSDKVSFVEAIPEYDHGS